MNEIDFQDIECNELLFPLLMSRDESTDGQMKISHGHFWNCTESSSKKKNQFISPSNNILKLFCIFSNYNIVAVSGLTKMC